MEALSAKIRQWSLELGFADIGITDTDLSEAEIHLQNWLKNNYHGNMEYMQRHGNKRSQPKLLHPDTVTVISVRLDYLPEVQQRMKQILSDPVSAYISRYALGRDYHKLMRQRLQKLVDKIQSAYGEFSCRVFVDSAPVLEKALAEKAGLGWIGKNTNLINQKQGSWFFLGEIYTSLALPVDKKASAHCGDCIACLKICPTQAFISPWQLDARRCISYLTIELKGSIPEKLRPLIGNRIYGCDDCQLICPWNRFAKCGKEKDFSPRHQLDSIQLLEVFSWSEAQFLARTEGSAIRRIGYDSWLRNIAVALGNAPKSPVIAHALKARMNHVSPMVNEHILWALARQASENTHTSTSWQES
jgi:epoxyqueuosine reductase